MKPVNEEIVNNQIEISSNEFIKSKTYNSIKQKNLRKMETKVIEDMCRCCGHHCDELISIDEEVGEKFSLSNTFGKLSTLMAECIHIDVNITNIFFHFL